MSRPFTFAFNLCVLSVSAVIEPQRRKDSMRKHFAIVLTFLLTFLAYSTSAIYAKDSWNSVTSRNFLVIGNGSEKDNRNVALKLEQFRDAMSQLFPRMVISSPVPTTVIVFKSDSSYRPFKANPNNAGYFQSGPDVNYITLTTEVQGQQDPFNIIFHEYSHLLINNTIGKAPTWFNEGLAEYFSTFSITNDQRVQVGRPISSHVYLLRQTRMLPLKTLFEVDQKSPYYNERAKQSIFYAQSWALTHYLLLNQNQHRATQMARFIDLMSSQTPVEKAFSQAFNSSFETMESELREYVRQDRYRMMQRTVEHKLDSNSELKSKPISEAEAMGHLGDLLLHGNRPEAETYLLKALELDPTLAMAHASLGMLRLRQGRQDEARASLERAVAANSQNYLIHYYYAYVLGKPPKDDVQINYGYPTKLAALIRSELKKTIALRPDFPESYNLLAFINLVTNTDLDESIEMLNRALINSPGRVDFMYMLGQLYVNKDRYKTARPFLEAVAASDEEEKVRRHARKLLETIDAIEEQRAKRARLPQETGTTPTGGTQLMPHDEEQPLPEDASATLRRVLRQPAHGEKRAQGLLLRVECGLSNFIFVVKVGDRVLKLKSESFRKLGLITYDADVKGEVTCGPRIPVTSVVIYFSPNSDTRDKSDGWLRSLAFVPADFQL
jgi:tetratricopeptide (TPR) repeat protein